MFGLKSEKVRLAGLRVLVVEDETMIALMIEDMLADLGCSVVGTASNLTTGMAMASAPSFDVAVLDVNLGGRDGSPIAAELKARGVPFVFATGLSDIELGPTIFGAPILKKPFTARALRKALTQAVSEARRAATADVVSS